MIFYAPNIHVGGGWELLKLLLSSLASEKGHVYILDARVSSYVESYSLENIFFIKPNLISRFKGEVLLKKLSLLHKSVFCFHGLPPVFVSEKDCKILIFLQNRLYINEFPLKGYGVKRTLRLAFEKTIFNILSYKVSEYIVQSKSMQTDMKKKFSLDDEKIRVAPFFSTNFDFNSINDLDKKNDFIYVADDHDHKNHSALLDAWEKLSERGVFPTLALTLPESNKYSKRIQELVTDRGCRIVNLGIISHQNIMRAYLESHFLIYPSLIESFGIPLIEADLLGLPIVASELDYVRDVVNPVQTFNPKSAISICLAVLRALEKEIIKEKVLSPEQFIKKIL